MSLLYPLALLSLLSIIILIIIYLIKPNYQSKFVSSTYIWKLSLKYKRKKLPTSKLRNFFLILTQILILTLISFIVSYPVIKSNVTAKDKESILILDSSASMRTESNGQTRFIRAVESIKSKALEVCNNDGLVTIIVAENQPEIIIEKNGIDKQASINSALDELVANETKCYYGTSDIDKSIEVCDEILNANPTADVYLYTDTDFDYVPKNVNLVKIYDIDEYNYAILDAKVNYYENYYDIVIDLASYGYDSNHAKDVAIDVNVHVDGANAFDKDDNGELRDFKTTVFCPLNTENKLIFRGSQASYDQDENVTIVELNDDNFYSFKSISISLDENDSYKYDNNFYIYGGQKEVIKIQYSSNNPNPFITHVLTTLKDFYKETFDIQLTEEKEGKPVLEGFDYYIFEHKMPTELPRDGVSIMLDPLSNPTNSGFVVDSIDDFNKDLVALEIEDGASDDILLNSITVGNILVSRINKMSRFDDNYKILASVNNSPVMMYKNDGSSKVFVMNFSVHYSNIALLKEFPILFNNIFKRFTPSLVEKNDFEIGDNIYFKSRGSSIILENSNDEKIEFKDFSSSYLVEEPGSLTVSQTTDFDKDISETLYVRTPRSESNIFDKQNALRDIYYEEEVTELLDDLVLYFAIGLVALLFFEWWLKNRENA